MREVIVSIDKLAFGGAGLGRVEGKVCFVPFTAVGDIARVRIVSEKKSYMEGVLLECIEASPSRTNPPCAVFGDCGGCCWQHLPYDVQLKAKQDIFAEALWRIARVGPEAILPIIPAPSPYGYRSRVQFKIRNVAGQIHMGFYRQGSHFVIGIPSMCRIACSEVNSIYAALFPLLADYPGIDRLPQIDAAVGDNGEATLLFHHVGEKPDKAAEWIEKTIPGAVPVTGIFMQGGRKSTMRRIWGEGRVSYTIPESPMPVFPKMTLSFSCGGFSQVNYSQNLALVQDVLRWSRLTGAERVLDLFCGNGNFSLPVAGYCAEVTGCEEYEQSIADAVHNKRFNHVNNATFVCLDATEAVRGMASRGEHYDIVLLDPPRAGASDVVRLIPLLEPEKIIYVSCDPQTLARDLAILQKCGYGVSVSRPVDMFPQTHHIESVTVLDRNLSQ